jgi:hypothetical protein
MPRPVIIRMDHHLPPRPTPLSAEAISSVFGGCAGRGQPCNFDTYPITNRMGNCCVGLCDWTPGTENPRIYICRG